MENAFRCGYFGSYVENKIISMYKKLAAINAYILSTDNRYQDSGVVLARTQCVNDILYRPAKGINIRQQAQYRSLLFICSFHLKKDQM